MDNVKEIRVICQCLRTLNVSGYRSLLDDHRTQKLSSVTAIELHVIAQLLQLPTYDVITEQLRAHPELQQAIGLESISSAQLSRKTNSLCTPLAVVNVRLCQALGHSGCFRMWICLQTKPQLPYVWLSLRMARAAATG